MRSPYPLAVALVAALTLALPRQVVAGPLRVGVCELLAHPERFIGQSVAITGTLNLGRHVSLITDGSCPKGVGIDIRDVQQGSEWQRIEAERLTPHNGAVRLELMGVRTTAVGVFERTTDPKLLYVVRLRELRDMIIPAP